jgi:hypothetical protein
MLTVRTPLFSFPNTGYCSSSYNSYNPLEIVLDGFEELLLFLIHVFAIMQSPTCHTWRAAKVLVTAALESKSFLHVGTTVHY